MNEISPYQNNTYITSSNEPIDVYLAEEFINGNCTINAIISPNAQYALPFYQTRDTLLDVERYKHFSACNKYCRKNYYIRSCSIIKTGA